MYVEPWHIGHLKGSGSPSAWRGRGGVFDSDLVCGGSRVSLMYNGDGQSCDGLTNSKHSAFSSFVSHKEQKSRAF